MLRQDEYRYIRQIIENEWGNLNAENERENNGRNMFYSVS